MLFFFYLIFLYQPPFFLIFGSNFSALFIIIFPLVHIVITIPVHFSSFLIPIQFCNFCKFCFYNSVSVIFRLMIHSSC